MVGIVLLSCSTKSFNSEKDLWTYLKDEKNGYIHSKNINGYDFSLIYKPTDLLVAQELGGDFSDKKKIKSLRDKYKKYLYFTLSMSKGQQELLSTAPKNRQEFGAMVNQLAFGMRDKVHLFSQQKDTLEMLDYVYPRMYGMSRATTMLFVYPRDSKYLHDEYLNFTIEDLGIYTGEIKFKTLVKKIVNEPKLSFKKDR